MYVNDLLISLLMLAGIRLIAFIMFLVLYINRGGVKYLLLSSGWFIYMLSPLPNLLNSSQYVNQLHPFTAFFAASATSLLMISLVLFIRNLEKKVLLPVIIIPVVIFAVLILIFPDYSGIISIFIQGLFLLFLLFVVIFNRSLLNSQPNNISFFWLCMTLLFGAFHAVGFNLFFRNAQLSLRFVITALLNLSFFIYFFYLDWEQSQKEIDKSLKEKEILLQEVHHRVKNNLTIISSIMQIQLNSIENFESRNIIRSIENRINTMALVHDKLYRSKNFKDIDIRCYLEDLVDGIKISFEGDSKPVDIIMNILPVSLDIDQLIPIGMLMNEILTNAFKHAFAAVAEPELRIELVGDDPNGYTLSIKDNGKGFFRYSENGEGAESTGFIIIDALVYQLGASLKVIKSEGTEYRLFFPPGKIRGVNKKK